MSERMMPKGRSLRCSRIMKAPGPTSPTLGSRPRCKGLGQVMVSVAAMALRPTASVRKTLGSSTRFSLMKKRPLSVVYLNTSLPFHRESRSSSSVVGGRSAVRWWRLCA